MSENNMYKPLWDQTGLQPQLISARNEREDRPALLRAVSVTEKGVAVCEHGIADTVMRLAAVRVGDGNYAEHVPFEIRDDELYFPLPADRSSKIGFFVGYAGSRSVASVVRIGDYPGRPLVTLNGRNIHEAPGEAMVSLAGIKPQETDEQLWAGQVGLYDSGKLDFDPARSRGVFGMAHQVRRDSERWERRRFVVAPGGMHDQAASTAADIRSDVLQVLGYDVTSPPRPAAALPLYDRSGLGARSPLMHLGASTYGGLVTGFGKSFEGQPSLTRVQQHNLQAAFEVHITPRA
jgi:hypothetical protein